MRHLPYLIRPIMRCLCACHGSCWVYLYTLICAPIHRRTKGRWSLWHARGEGQGADVHDVLLIAGCSARRSIVQAAYMPAPQLSLPRRSVDRPSPLTATVSTHRHRRAAAAMHVQHRAVHATGMRQSTAEIALAGHSQTPQRTGLFWKGKCKSSDVIELRVQKGGA